MYIVADITSFCKTLIRYVGNGYDQMQVSYIPNKKRHKTKQIRAKLSNKYQTNLSSGKRQYRRKKGLCNYIGIQFKDIFFIILKTKGSEPNFNEKWQSVYRYSFQLGKFLKVELIKDERGKNTFKLEKETIKDIRSNIQVTIQKHNKSKFYNEITKLYNLHKILRYRGFYIQLSTILKDIKQLQIKHNTKYNLPKFF